MIELCQGCIARNIPEVRPVSNSTSIRHLGRLSEVTWLKKKTFISSEKLKVMWKNLKQNCIRITPFFSYLWITFCCFTSIFYFVLTSFIYLRYFSGTRVRTGADQVAKIMKSTQKVLIRHLIAGFTLFQNSSILFHFI